MQSRSFRRRPGQNMHIVIVDNGSGNGSEEWLAEHFIDEKRVRVIASGENLGFARREQSRHPLCERAL